MTSLLIFILGLCLLGGTFFAGFETGVISINRLRLQHLVRRNAPGAKLIRHYITHPDKLLATTLIGTNVCHVVASMCAAALGAHIGGRTGTVVAGILLTLVLLVFCEYLPKAWFQAAPAVRTLPFAKLFDLLAKLLLPVSAVVNGIVHLLIPSTRKSTSNQRMMVTREELMYLTREGVKSGVLTNHESEMIHGVFQLTHKTCGEIMTPRDSMIVVQHSDNVEDVLALARQKDVNRFPVYNTQKQAFVGIVHIFDLLADTQPDGKTAADYMRLPQLVGAHLPVDHLLPRMRVTKLPLVLVTDERYEVVGLITMEDVLDEITGES